jgi:hypothetical protein
MTDKRLILALAPLTIIAACSEEPTGDGRAASGEVLEGTISDAMLPLDRVRSEPPLEDPEAFAEVQEQAAEATPDELTGEIEGGAPDAEAAATSETVVVPPLEPAD